MNVKRVDLIKQLVDQKHYTKKSATALVDDFVDIILYNMLEGNSVSIHNFGCFDLLERAARQCPNPVTGERVDVPAHYIPRFYPGAGMRKAVKIWEDNQKRGLK